jgi:hypothetical protein
MITSLLQIDLDLVAVTSTNTQLPLEKCVINTLAHKNRIGYIIPDTDLPPTLRRARRICVAFFSEPDKLYYFVPEELTLMVHVNPDNLLRVYAKPNLEPVKRES